MRLHENLLNSFNSQNNHCIKLSLLLFGFMLLLTSCYTELFLTYSIQNRTNKPVKLKIHDFPVKQIPWPPFVDTIITLKPNQKVNIAYRSRRGRPCGTKDLYRVHPGSYNFNIINADTILQLNSNDSVWTYWNKTSTFKIRKSLFKIKKKHNP
jgi:hypothetical protein